jgi:mannose-6-phosphate isomerase-like protein (cupin superfamily)
MTDRMIARAAGGGPATWAMGGLFERLTNGAETGGILDASLVTQPPGIAPPLHVHTREAEAWYVLDGTLTYQAGDQRVDLEPGGFIFLPQGLPHAFRTTGSVPVRYLALTLPGAVMGLYDEVGTPAPQRRLPDGGVTGEDVARWLAAAPRYGLQIVGPPIPG